MTNNNMQPNRLKNEKSPYLLQHVLNPVNWYPWCDEAFEKAQAENKPIFLSIGYSTCHWCHVMERESFEDEQIAKYLNEHYISIKVDREERPDVDHIYMTACQAMTGHGGWPLSVFMTPDKKPFYIGTYFPPESKWGKPGFIEVIQQLHEKWENEHDKVLAASEQMVKSVEPRYSKFEPGEVEYRTLTRAYKQFAADYDTKFGGFGGAPKFPTPHNLMFLLRYWKQTGDEQALNMVEKTLDSMYRGGIYDHIGFGFARYSTDQQWLIPHFEKMLYDNALLAYTYLEAYQATGKDDYARAADEIFTYVLRDMTDEQGGFCSAEDADSEGEEGKFYVWTPQEVNDILDFEDAALYCKVYDISECANFENKSIPNLINTSYVRIAHEYGISQEELRTRLEQIRLKLFDARDKRIKPLKDDKILTAWNGLMIAAFAKGAQVLKKPIYKDVARRSIDFIMTYLRRSDGRLLARFRDGESKYLAYLDDYAFLIWGLIEQYEASFEMRYLEQAIELHQQMKELFWDEQKHGYFFYGNDGEELISRPKEIYDGAIPSGNSVAVYNALRLARITGKQEYEQEAEQIMRAFAGTINEYPRAYSFFLIAIQFALGNTGRRPPITEDSKDIQELVPTDEAQAQIQTQAQTQYQTQSQPQA
ncbi:thioredoxin domain-containing protein [Desulfuribacillus alkaliarsenatis]|uniref:Thioredoxin n=1 Tax=Desulfuribacillus alkaliarsenatis TaxID=766136 RepID=A0A1E5FZ51_9FIRM|nr:thioredoxin domain-containing protein [Desulfuribacillus alkaliarsenatis]OEF95850.1 thioredoxin [Desulfuribacillus alkaliarsenatis]